MAANPPVDDQVAYWGKEIELAKKRFRTFWENGERVIDEYRLQKSDGNDANNKDKYNILYSSTETIRPNLYAQQPNARVKLVSKDTASDTARAAALLLEGCLGYLQREEDFDELMDNVVEDYLLPGLGNAWVRYESTVEGEGENAKLLDEMVKMEYVHWRDCLFGVARTWKELPWGAKRLWKTKAEATKRFGAEIANKLKYATRDGAGRDADHPNDTAEIWEIWDKPSMKVYWYSEGCPTLLDTQPDPLKLKKFFPFPRPIRAISNTRTLVPRALYSQYKSQAETLNTLTKRIRLLGEGLRVVGLFDGSQKALADLLNANAGNRMIAVDNWAAFQQTNGLNGSVVWLPIEQIAKVLNELLQAREVCKQEIYEITGFSDIVRGVSKASETLGAQNLKANWAGARVKKAQKEVQRFARDVLALAGELVAEHCGPDTIAMFSGVQIPDPKAVQNDPQAQQRVQLFTQACALIKNEIRRVATIDIETDSTLLADEESEREDRTKFLAAAGAFLQQAVPAMEATPELGPLLGSMLMFVVRTFPTSRPIEDEFEKVQQVLASKAQGGQDQDKGGEKAKAAVEQARIAAEQQSAQAATAQAAQEAAMTHAREQQSEVNRHAEKMAEIALRNKELAMKAAEMAFKDRELTIQENEERTARFTAIHNAALQEIGLEAETRQDAQELAHEINSLDTQVDENAADRAHEAAQADADRAHEADQGEADREAAAQAAAEAAAEAPPGGTGGEGT
jgi:hypothetical protein